MTTIHQKAANVISIIGENSEVLWAWASAEHYAQVVSAHGDDLLVRVGQRFDFAPLEAACQGYRRYGGQRGQEATHTIGQLCRALLAKWLKGWSYRQTCRELSSNSLLRWFVGYRLYESTLSYVTLQRFEAWVRQHQGRLFFDELLRQMDQDFPQEQTQPQVGDTFALYAKVTRQSRTELLRDGCRRLLAHWQSLSPQQPLPGLNEALSEALWGRERERPEFVLEKAERDERACQTALAAAVFLGLAQQARRLLPTGPSLLQAAFERWLALVAKLLSDEFVFERNAAGEALSARQATDQERGRFVLGSTVDPEATFRKHGKRVDLGYNIHVAASEAFVREIFATTGAVPDASGVAALLAHQQAAGFPLPKKLIYDRAAGSAKTFQAVHRASGGQTQLVAALIDHSKGKERFGPLDFTLNEDGSLTCPGGQTTTKAYRSNSADGWTYRFSAQQCQGCPFWDQCRGPRPATPETESGEATTADTPAPSKKRRGPKPNSHRQVFISAYRSLQRQAIRYTQSDAFKEDMKRRPAIERIIAALVRYNGARRAHSIGLAKADDQVRMAATAFNLKRWLVLTLAREKAQRVRRGHDPPEENDG